jgi:hypothetical protein
MALAIQQSQQCSICRQCKYFHHSIHVGHEISSISQGQSIWQRTDEGKTPTKGCLTFRPTLWKSQGARRHYGKDAQNCQILHSYAPPGK